MNEFLDQARALLGAEHVLTTQVDAWATDWRGKLHGVPLAVLRPADTAQVAACVALCAAHGVAMVPQGGNTGMCGGATPDASGRQVVISLSRLHRIRAVDAANHTVTVEAGCVLQAVQEEAARHDLLFPLSFGAEGSCQIGGNIATNAGGMQVLRWGNTRDLVLGLEVVLPDGQVLDLMRGLRKDNTGYDMKQWFIGAEGTLGIITAAVLKLVPSPRAVAVAMAAVDSPAQALALLNLLRERVGERIAAFELMSAATVALIRRHFPASPALFDAAPPWQVLIEVSDGGEQAALDEALQAALEHAFEQGVLTDVVVATSQAQARALWELRENISEAQQHDGQNIKHDIAVPLSQVAAFIAEAEPPLHAAWPGVRPFIYGHLGDGNLHFNISRPEGWSVADWQAQTAQVNTLVLDVVARHRGSFSAEHGLGQLKNHEVAIYKSPLEVTLMRRFKQMLDPRNLMNPGKFLPQA